MSENWVNKHSPQTIGQIQGNSDAVKRTMAYIRTFLANPERKVLLYAGPPGTGKTSLAKMMAKACKIESIVINCSSDRDVKSIQEKITPHLFTKTINDGEQILTNNHVMIILDELDGQYHREKGKQSPVFSFIRQALKVTENPIIATCNSKYNIPSDFLTESCTLVKFMRTSDLTIRNILTDICNKENIKLSHEILNKIIMKGDIRASINALQLYVISGEIIPQLEKDTNIFDTTKNCLIHHTNIHPSIIVEDLPLFLEEAGFPIVAGTDRYNFYRVLEEASMLVGFGGNFRVDDARNLLGMIKSSISRPYTDNAFIVTHVPSYISRLRYKKEINATIKSLAKKLAPDYNESSDKFISSELPLLQKICELNLEYAQKLSIRYALEKPEIAILLNATQNDPRINKIMIPDKALTKNVPLPSPQEASTNEIENLYAQDLD